MVMLPLSRTLPATMSHPLQLCDQFPWTSTWMMSLDGELLVNGLPDGVSMKTMPFGGGEPKVCEPCRYVPWAFAIAFSMSMSESFKRKPAKVSGDVPATDG